MPGLFPPRDASIAFLWKYNFFKKDDITNDFEQWCDQSYLKQQNIQSLSTCSVKNTVNRRAKLIKQRCLRQLQTGLKKKTGQAGSVGCQLKRFTYNNKIWSWIWWSTSSENFTYNSSKTWTLRRTAGYQLALNIQLDKLLTLHYGGRTADDKGWVKWINISNGLRTNKRQW